jgi:hypothetical protein
MATNLSLRREFLGTLIETSRHLRHFVDRRAQRLGLTGAQLRLLSKLRRQEGASQAALATRWKCGRSLFPVSSTSWRSKAWWSGAPTETTVGSTASI